jgi:hypothetical protein
MSSILFNACTLCNFKNHRKVSKCLMCQEPIVRTKHTNRPPGYYFNKFDKNFQEMIKGMVLDSILEHNTVGQNHYQLLFKRLCYDVADMLQSYRESKKNEFNMNAHIDKWASQIKHMGLLSHDPMYKKCCNFIYNNLMLRYVSGYIKME